jgi:lipopolysaccharide biosynthesis protein
VNLLNEEFEGTVFDFRDLILSSYYNSRMTKFPLYKAVSPGWDNEPRKPGKGTSFIHSNPEAYESWLEDASKYALSNSKVTDPIVFINAWNEWGEGSYLEPDRKYGYAYLQATRNVLEKLNITETINWRVQNAIKRKHDTAVILHLYYPEIWENIRDYLNQLDGDFDLFVSIPKVVDFDTRAITQIYSNSYFFHCENRGRDIAPFLNILPILVNHEYQFALKLHTKKTIHRANGVEWRQDVLNKLIGSKKNIELSKNLLKNENIGIVAPAGHVLPSIFYWGLDKESSMNKKYIEDLSIELSIPNHEFPFVAGSMFWFKPSALKPLLKLNIDTLSFEPEFGQKDGTLANAFERFIGLAIQEFGLNIFEVDEYGNASKVIYEEIVKRNHYAYALATHNGHPYKVDGAT